jgi:hypothetical protein
MWFRAELGYQYWTQRQLVNSAGAFTMGWGGINLSGLQDVISDSTAVGTIQMYTKVFNSAADVPDIGDLLLHVGYVYVAFMATKGGGGHVNLLMGYNGLNTYLAADPDPGVGMTGRDHEVYFSFFPGMVGWRLTPSLPGLGYTGKAPWEY